MHIPNVNKKPKTIGLRKYKALKKINFNDLSEENLDNFQMEFNIPFATGRKELEDYEKVHIIPQAKLQDKYFKKIKNAPTRKPKILTRELLLELFLKAFETNEKHPFIINKITLENLEPILQYFLGNLENFRNCKNVNSISEPSLEKGLLVIGGYGCGKTAMFKAFESVFKHTNYIFKGYTANQVVNMYESCTNPLDKKEFNKVMFNGIRYFDDLLTERVASNYGSVDIFKEIIETRYINKVKTFITCNWKEGEHGNVREALLQFLRYGNRAYDRFFETLNVVVFPNESFRK